MVSKIKEAAKKYCKDTYKEDFDDPAFSPDVYLSMQDFTAGANWQLSQSKLYACKFSEWTEKNYTMVYSKHYSKWVNREGVLIHGSDSYYSDLITEHGKTIQELYNEFKQK